MAVEFDAFRLQAIDANGGMTVKGQRPSIGAPRTVEGASIVPLPPDIVAAFEMATAPAWSLGFIPVTKALGGIRNNCIAS